MNPYKHPPLTPEARRAFDEANKGDWKAADLLFSGQVCKPVEASEEERKKNRAKWDEFKRLSGEPQVIPVAEREELAEMVN